MLRPPPLKQAPPVSEQTTPVLRLHSVAAVALVEVDSHFAVVMIRPPGVTVAVTVAVAVTVTVAGAE